MTVITIVLIAIVLGVGTLIVNNLMDTTEAKSRCMNAGYAGTTRDGKQCVTVTGEKVAIPNS